MSKKYPPQVKASRIMYQGFFDLREDLLVDYQGNEYTYCCLAAKVDGVIVLPEISPHQFILTLEHRYPIQRKVLSCPGGGISPQEDPLVAAQRELLEETGYIASTWTTLQLFYPFPSTCTQKIYLYLAQNLTKVSEPHLEPLEQIELKCYSWDELMELDFSTYMLDGALPTSLLLYKQHLHRKAKQTLQKEQVLVSGSHLKS